MSQVRTKKVAAAVRAIRALYAKGREIPPKRPHGATYDTGEVRAAGLRVGLSPELARQARQFADPAAGYTRGELAELCALVRDRQRHQADDLPVFGVTHVCRLLSVPRPRRAELQREAVEGGWSTARLEAVIAARFGRRRAGGRKRVLPRDAAGLMAQLEAMCESWRRLLLAVDRRREAGAPAHAVLADLSPPVHRDVRAAGEALGRLQGTVVRHLAKVHPGRAEASTDRPSGG